MRVCFMRRNVRNVLRILAVASFFIIGYLFAPADTKQQFSSYFLSGTALWIFLLAVLLASSAQFYFVWERKKHFLSKDFLYRFIYTPQQLLDGFKNRLEHRDWSYSHSYDGWEVYVRSAYKNNLGSFLSGRFWLLRWADARVSLKLVDDGVLVIATSSFLKDFSPVFPEGDISYRN